MLKNKVAVISGCNRGIGLSTLEAFSENGADIFACVRNIDDNFLKKIDVLKLNYGNKIFPVKFDLSNKDSIVSAINLINNYEKRTNYTKTNKVKECFRN